MRVTRSAMPISARTAIQRVTRPGMTPMTKASFVTTEMAMFCFMILMDLLPSSMA